MSHFVLVHGSFSGAWSWDPVRAGLEVRGHGVDAVDLPGRESPDPERAQLTLADYARVVAEAVAAAPEPVILVGHSLGGQIITEVAEWMPERVRRLGYLAAFLPGPGQSVLDLIGASFKAESLVYRHQVVDRDSGMSWLPAEHRRATLYALADPAVAEAAGARLISEPVAFQATPVSLTPERGGRVPRVYLETLQDRTIPLASQREMQAAVGVERVISLDTDHSPGLSAPEMLVAALESLA